MKITYDRTKDRYECSGETDLYTIKENGSGIAVIFENTEAANFARAALLLSGKAPQDIGLVLPPKEGSVASQTPGSQMNSHIIYINGMTSKEFAHLYLNAYVDTEHAQTIARKLGETISKPLVRYSKGKHNFEVAILTTVPAPYFTQALNENGFGAVESIKEGNPPQKFIALAMPKDKTGLEVLHDMAKNIRRASENNWFVGKG